ncbi:MAG: hypothetical protein DRJ15_14135 [Bacteroidetes bacterium]|nr:MAG: hypothetical protein DRJ15_14135 [Bacteroidota bacterium]
MEKEGYTILHDLLSKDLQLEEDEALISGEEKPDLNLFHQKLTILVLYLLDRDMPRLLNAMYRLDVNEQKFHEVMQSESKEEAASNIARLVLEREMQKVKTRLHYKTHRKF